jgi:ADP-ribose pyrophosphatase
VEDSSFRSLRNLLRAGQAEDFRLPKGLHVLNSRMLYQGKVVRLKVDRVVEPGGIEATREIVCHSGSVVVLPRLNDGRILLVRQFRYAAGQSLWELVAGGMEPGESIRRAALRELREETGCHAQVVRPLFKFYPSPGFLTERMHLVEARGLACAKAELEPDERIRLGKFTLPELRRMVRRGRILDAKTLVGVLWLLKPF